MDVFVYEDGSKVFSPKTPSLFEWPDVPKLGSRQT